MNNSHNFEGNFGNDQLAATVRGVYKMTHGQTHGQMPLEQIEAIAIAHMGDPSGICAAPFKYVLWATVCDFIEGQPTHRVEKVTRGAVALLKSIYGKYAQGILTALRQRDVAGSDAGVFNDARDQCILAKRLVCGVVGLLASPGDIINGDYGVDYSAMFDQINIRLCKDMLPGHKDALDAHNLDFSSDPTTAYKLNYALFTGRHDLDSITTQTGVVVTSAAKLYMVWFVEMVVHSLNATTMPRAKSAM